MIFLREKAGTTRWQPVSPTLTRHLLDHADVRNSAGSAGSGSPLLRYRDGRPITRRRYDHLWRRIGLELPWVATQQITTHWIRHTTLTSLGFAVVATACTIVAAWLPLSAWRIVVPGQRDARRPRHGLVLVVSERDRPAGRTGRPQALMLATSAAKDLVRRRLRV